LISILTTTVNTSHIKTVTTSNQITHCMRAYLVHNGASQIIQLFLRTLDLSLL